MTNFDKIKEEMKRRYRGTYLLESCGGGDDDKALRKLLLNRFTITEKGDLILCEDISCTPCMFGSPSSRDCTQAFDKWLNEEVALPEKPRVEKKIAAEEPKEAGKDEEKLDVFTEISKVFSDVRDMNEAIADIMKSSAWKTLTSDDGIGVAGIAILCEQMALSLDMSTEELHRVIKTISKVTEGILRKTKEEKLNLE